MFPAEDIQAQLADHVELGLAIRQLRRQQAVVLMVGEPLPVIRRINDAGRGFALEQGFHALAVPGG